MVSKRLTKARKEYISAEAEAVLEHLLVTEVPIDPFLIASKNGIAICANNYNKDFLAAIGYQDEQFSIHIHVDREDYIHVTRMRFSVAHELGHYFIYNHRTELLKHGHMPSAEKGLVESGRISEKEAEYFASCLLMPEKLIKTDFAEKLFLPALLHRTARKYRVSLTAVASRYIQLGELPIMIVWSRKGKVDKKFPSKDYPYHRLNSLKEGYMPKASLAATYWENPPAEGNGTKLILASDLFVSDRGIPEAMQFFEYCFVHKKSQQVVSIFWHEPEVEVFDPEPYDLLVDDDMVLNDSSLGQIPESDSLGYNKEPKSSLDLSF